MLDLCSKTAKGASTRIDISSSLCSCKSSAFCRKTQANFASIYLYRAFMPLAVAIQIIKISSTFEGLKSLISWLVEVGSVEENLSVGSCQVLIGWTAADHVLLLHVAGLRKKRRNFEKNKTFK
jgi:hypothetical protein